MNDDEDLRKVLSDIPWSAILVPTLLGVLVAVAAILLVLKNN